MASSSPSSIHAHIATLRPDVVMSHQAEALGLSLRFLGTANRTAGSVARCDLEHIEEMAELDAQASIDAFQPQFDEDEDGNLFTHPAYEFTAETYSIAAKQRDSLESICVFLETASGFGDTLRDALNLLDQCMAEHDAPDGAVRPMYLDNTGDKWWNSIPQATSKVDTFPY